MSEACLHNLLGRLNAGDRERIYSRSLSPEVDWATVYLSDGFKSNFYFIKNEISHYVGIIEYKRRDDLHWYVLPEYRKQGYLSKNLAKIILPHIAYANGILHQGITIDRRIGEQNRKNSEGVALKLGFKYLKTQDNIDYYECDLSAYDISIDLDGVDQPLGKDRVNEIINQIKYSRIILGELGDEVNMAYSDSLELTNVIDETDYKLYLLLTLFKDKSHNP